MWITVEVERVLRVDRGRNVILCELMPGPFDQTLVLKLKGSEMPFVKIKGATANFSKPSNWDEKSEGSCGDLWVRVDRYGARKQHNFAWKPDANDLAILNAGGEIETHIINDYMPPVGVSVVKPDKPQEVREPGFVKPDNHRQVFFYEQDFYVLSNFSAFQVRSYGIDFATSEHLYHWEKFNGDASHQPEIQLEIRFARSAHDAFKIAEEHKASRRTNWNDVRVNVMRSILRAKVEQHEYVRRKLLATGDRELIEDSWRDDFWGWGPNRDGQNMLGKLWMEVRSELREASAP